MFYKPNSPSSDLLTGFISCCFSSFYNLLSLPTFIVCLGREAENKYEYETQTFEEDMGKRREMEALSVSVSFRRSFSQSQCLAGTDRDEGFYI
jgi:hypothetical protein